jgi:hypothetical protein
LNQIIRVCPWIVGTALFIKNKRMLTFRDILFN